MTKRSGIGLALTMALLACVGILPARAGGAVADNATPAGNPTVRVTHTAEGYAVEGRCSTAAPRSTAWQVLTDYNAIDGFVSSMRESRVYDRSDDGKLLVEQIAEGRLLMFRRRMTVMLSIEEQPESLLRFDDVRHQDFAVYRGEWRIEERDGHREIAYRVVARPSFRVPDMIARGMFARTVRELLSEVEAEMARRTPPTSAALSTVP